MEQLHFDEIFTTYVVFAVFSALLHAMPPPNGNKWYNFLYRFLHTLAMNLDRMRTPAKETHEDGGK